MELEPQLLPTAVHALPDATHPQARHLLAAARSWGTLAQLQPVLAKWVAAQAAGFNVWVARQFEKEDWRPLGEEQVGSSRRSAVGSLSAAGP
jgi:hypothetical protein